MPSQHLLYPRVVRVVPRTLDRSRQPATRHDAHAMTARFLLLDDQPDYALMPSWHIGDELAATFREIGYRGEFVVPLPSPRGL